MKFHRTSLTKKYKILFDETVGTNDSFFIYIYILIGFDVELATSRIWKLHR